MRVNGAVDNPPEILLADERPIFLARSHLAAASAPFWPRRLKSHSGWGPWDGGWGEGGGKGWLGGGACLRRSASASAAASVLVPPRFPKFHDRFRLLSFFFFFLFCASSFYSSFFCCFSFLFLFLVSSSSFVFFLFLFSSFLSLSSVFFSFLLSYSASSSLLNFFPIPSRFVFFLVSLTHSPPAEQSWRDL